ncbi:MAG TPA: hypothetical protein VJ249_07355 [Candidatus Bathyarchaeia archaeon]|nr:hypothetical protein [Candidatus Bathyarchaeia archaeon]
MALSFDMLTGLTISIILGILTVYVIVVYKKGWLRRESREDQAYYLCPSQKCRRVFKKPVWLTDLSKTPPESYQACPHCGVSIQTFNSASLQAKPVPEVSAKPASFPRQGQSQVDNPRSSKDEASTAKMRPVDESPRPVLQASPSQSTKPEGWQATRPIFKFPHIRNDPFQMQPEAPKKSTEKDPNENPKKCSHFFGYVKTLPKNMPIPDECLWCPSIVDCLSHEQKVEAEA